MAKLTPRENALLALVVLQVIMLGAFFFERPPHPPLTTPGFAMGPFLSLSVATATAALFAPRGGAASGLSLLAMLLAMVSYGPHKWFDPLIGQIWPAIVGAQVAALLVLWAVVGELRQ